MQMSSPQLNHTEVYFGKKKTKNVESMIYRENQKKPKIPREKIMLALRKNLGWIHED